MDDADGSDGSDGSEDGCTSNDDASAGGGNGDGGEPRVRVLQRKILSNGSVVCTSAGSVLDFGVGTGWPPAATAVVNAANTGGLGGGGIDRAIADAGGEALRADRRNLPPLSRGSVDRIPEGGARSTGPNDYDKLFGQTVIHAVGPDYAHYAPGDFLTPDEVLRSAYADAMREAKQRRIEYLGFSLLSSGIFRGQQDLQMVVQIAMEAVEAGVYPGLREVHLVGYSDKEREALQLLRKRPATGVVGGIKSDSAHKRQRRRDAGSGVAAAAAKRPATDVASGSARKTPRRSLRHDAAGAGIPAAAVEH